MGCAPEASKPGQDVKLRLRARSPHFYTTHYGRQVPGTAYVDDGRHYTTGAASLFQANRELAAGSRFSGNASQPRKSAAFAKDWDSHCSTRQGIEEGFSPTGVAVQTYDIYTGMETPDTIPRAHVDTSDIFRGKGGTIADRHSAPAISLTCRVHQVL